MRKGLFLTRHQGEISRVVDVDELAGACSDVLVAKVYDQFFAPAEVRDLLYQVRRYRLDAVILAGFSARHMETSKEGKALVHALKTHGITPNRIAYANIYEQVALTHADRPFDATRKARLLIDVAAARLDYGPEVTTVTVRPKRTVLIMGTSVTGLMAAHELLSKNIEVILVDRAISWRIANPQDTTFAALCNQIAFNPNARIFFESDLADMTGWSGDYRIELNTPLGDKKIVCGGILLCPGSDTRWTADLAYRMRLAADAEGFLLNAAGDRSSGETRDAGIWFVAASGAGNGLKPESSGVQQAVFALSELLDRPGIEHPLLTPEVDASVCDGCGTCVKTCAFAASAIDAGRKTSVIDARRCRGCGVCVTACPTRARDLATFPTLYAHRAIEILSRGVCANGDPRILAFLCKNSGDIAADRFGRQAAKSGATGYSPNVLPLPMACGGHIDTAHLLKALKEGFDGVALVVCKARHCRNLAGNTDMQRRIGLLRAVLRSRRMGDDRMRVIHTDGHETRYFNEALRAFSEELKRLNASSRKASEACETSGPVLETASRK